MVIFENYYFFTIIFFVFFNNISQKYLKKLFKYFLRFF